MKLELALVFVAAAITAVYVSLPQHSVDKSEFEKFKEVFDKRYTKVKETYRYTIYQENVKKIEKHNADPTQTYKMAVTQFADMTQDEFEGTILKPLSKNPH